MGSRAVVLALSLAAAFTLSGCADEPKTAEVPKKTVEASKLVKAGTVTVEAIQAGIVVGDMVWGHGELTALGQTRKFRFNGLGVGAGGGAKITATGTVYNLKDMGLFAGVYSAGGIGAVAGKEETGTAVWLYNTNDVAIELHVTEKSGLAVTGGANGVLVQFED
ncbi:MAG: hypothetical protein WEF50_20625 [Myxococcota bacterium]